MNETNTTNNNLNIFFNQFNGEKLTTKYKNDFDNGELERLKLSGHKLWDDFFEGFVDGYYMIGGAPGAGKTTIMNELADFFAKDENNVVLFIETEMSEYSLLGKSLAKIMRYSDKCTAKLGEKEIRTGKRQMSTSAYIPLRDEDKNAIAESIKIYNDKIKNKYIVDEKCVAKFGLNNITELEKFCINFKRTMVNPDQNFIIFIDYMQQFFSEKFTTNENGDMKIVAQSMRRIAHMDNTLAFIASATSKANYNIETKNITQAVLKGSGAIEYNATGVVYVKPKTDENNQYVTDLRGARAMEFILLKNRNGETGKVFDGHVDFKSCTCYGE